MAVAVLSALSFSQSRSASYDPAGHKRPAKQQDGFLDFTLKRINPSDKDYGQCVDQGRGVLLEETVRSGYFWSNLVALGVLGCLLVIIIFQHRIGNRREWATVEMLAQFEQSLRRSSAQADEATKKNQAFKEALARLRESTLQSVPPPSDSGEISGSAAGKTRVSPPRAAAEASVKTSPAKAATRNDGNAVAVEPTNQMALFKADTALIMKVNALEQQLVRAEEQQKELRRQLNEAGRKLQAEQEKNRALKGA
jgi:hypothetical protein